MGDLPCGLARGAYSWLDVAACALHLPDAAQTLYRHSGTDYPRVCSCLWRGYGDWVGYCAGSLAGARRVVVAGGPGRRAGYLWSEPQTCYAALSCLAPCSSITIRQGARQAGRTRRAV